LTAFVFTISGMLSPPDSRVQVIESVITLILGHKRKTMMSRTKTSLAGLREKAKNAEIRTLAR
jgi:hypothetical protein